MLIHFAYAKYKDEPNLQIENAIKNIFSKRKLLFGKNPEFIPRLNQRYNPKFKANKGIPISFGQVSKGPNYIGIEVRENDNISENRYGYIKENIRMICFTDISLEDVATSIHVEQYGKLGIIFYEKFLEKYGIKKVYYYEENKLIDDEKVGHWNNQ